MLYYMDVSNYPKLCLPEPLYDRLYEDLIEVTAIGDTWKKFMNLESGKVYDCQDYYQALLILDDYQIEQI